jgi:hypothetical protein
VRARSRTVLIATACAMFLVFFVATRAFAQGLGGRLFVGALYDPVFHVTDETSSAGAHFDLSQNVIETTSSSISWVGEFGFNRFENETITGYLGGGRLAGQDQDPTRLPSRVLREQQPERDPARRRRDDSN